MEIVEQAVELTPPGWSLEEAVRLACEVVAGAEPGVIGSAQIVGGRRLSDAELARAHEIAAELGVALTMDDGGALSVHRSAPSAPSSSTRHGWREWLAHFGQHAGSGAA